MHSSIDLTTSPKVRSTDTPELALVTPPVRRSSAERFQSHLTKLEVLADFVTIIAAVMASHEVYHLLGLGRQINYPRSVVLGVSATFAAVVVLMLDRVGAYSRGTSLLRVRENRTIATVFP